MKTSTETQPLPSPSNDEAMWRGEVTAELRHIHHTIRDVQRELHALHSYVADQLDDHRAYHARNEVRWGPARWCERHPFQFSILLLGGAATVSLLRAGHDWMQIAGLLVQAAK